MYPAQENAGYSTGDYKSREEAGGDKQICSLLLECQRNVKSSERPSRGSDSCTFFRKEVRELGGLQKPVLVITSRPKLSGFQSRNSLKYRTMKGLYFSLEQGHEGLEECPSLWVFASGLLVLLVLPVTRMALLSGSHSPAIPFPSARALAWCQLRLCPARPQGETAPFARLWAGDSVGPK